MRLARPFFSPLKERTTLEDLAPVGGFYVMQYYSSCISCFPYRMPDETALFKSIKATRMVLISPGQPGI